MARAPLLLSILLSAIFFGCEPTALPKDSPQEPIRLALSFDEVSLPNKVGQGEKMSSMQLGSIDDNLPFNPEGLEIGSIAWRTWIYTDTGPQRTRLGFLRAGAVVAARGPKIVNAGCQGGWLRINPRGFICLGKGATTDLEHPVVRELRNYRPRMEGEFPYTYALSQREPPYRYFRLPSRQQVKKIEGARALDRGANWRERARKQGLLDRWKIDEELPSFFSPTFSLVKPWGVEQYLRHQVHAGRFSRDSGFALVDFFLWQGRAYGLTTELDLIPMDRTSLPDRSELRGVELPVGENFDFAFHHRGVVTLWEQTSSGAFRPHAEQRAKRVFLLTGERATGGMLKTKEGLWLAEPTVRVLKKRSHFPSIATGRRKWLDISIKNQTLVAYEGRRAVYATLVSTGRGGMGDPETEHATVRGTFMIHEKLISDTMDGEEDRSDSFQLKDVPFVQYFHRGFALHGAYWHDEFGRARSHGCVNLSPRDSAFLFSWTDPPLPKGWHGVQNKKRGTAVYVHR
ncbi:MAG: L,D-transpeptidase [Polyangiaceae bacterium]|nr:L,D-transpeptidase [Polyangiaceae bacterium]